MALTSKSHTKTFLIVHLVVIKLRVVGNIRKSEGHEPVYQFWLLFSYGCVFTTKRSILHSFTLKRSVIHARYWDSCENDGRLHLMGQIYSQNSPTATANFFLLLNLEARFLNCKMLIIKNYTPSLSPLNVIKTHNFQWEREHEFSISLHPIVFDRSP